MRLVVQRVKSASVTVDGDVVSSIGNGMLVLAGVEKDDAWQDCRWLADKLCALRIFDDGNGIMNLDIRQAVGSMLVVSQFTLHASTRKGNRPSYIRAAGGAEARALYEMFVEMVREAGIVTRTGEFGAHMEVELVNDGPVTIIMDSRNRE